MKWYIVAGLGLGIVVVAYSVSRRIGSSSPTSSGQRRPRNGVAAADESTPLAGIAVGEPYPSTPTKSGTVLSDCDCDGGIMAGYPGYSGFWAGGDCNCGGKA